MFLMIFEVRGVQVGSKNQSKIDPKMKSKWEGVIFSGGDARAPIYIYIYIIGFLRFGRSKLAVKINQKSIQK